MESTSLKAFVRQVCTQMSRMIAIGSVGLKMFAATGNTSEVDVATSLFASAVLFVCGGQF